MQSNELTEWRQRMRFDTKQASNELGVALRTYQAYEKGERHDGKPAAIPRYVDLSSRWLEMYAKLSNGGY